MKEALKAIIWMLVGAILFALLFRFQLIPSWLGLLGGVGGGAHILDQQSPIIVSDSSTRFFTIGTWVQDGGSGNYHIDGGSDPASNFKVGVDGATQSCSQSGVSDITLTAGDGTSSDTFDLTINGAGKTALKVAKGTLPSMPDAHTLEFGSTGWNLTSIKLDGGSACTFNSTNPQVLVQPYK